MQTTSENFGSLQKKGKRKISKDLTEAKKGTIHVEISSINQGNNDNLLYPQTEQARRGQYSRNKNTDNSNNNSIRISTESLRANSKNLTSSLNKTNKRDKKFNTLNTLDPLNQTYDGYSTIFKPTLNSF